MALDIISKNIRFQIRKKKKYELLSKDIDILTTINEFATSFSNAFNLIGSGVFILALFIISYEHIFSKIMESEIVFVSFLMVLVAAITVLYNRKTAIINSKNLLKDERAELIEVKRENKERLKTFYEPLSSWIHDVGHETHEIGKMVKNALSFYAKIKDEENCFERLEKLVPEIEEFRNSLYL
ncbi:MAG: hypothetical protein LBE57_03360 [Methanosarcinales archaeon]|jgi:hypothetical protein|nr:hypothetical protein [Methanosarcinales archaeon]